MRMDGLLSPSGLCRVLILGILFSNVGCYAANGWAMNRTGMKHYKRGHYAQARHKFARAIASDPCNADYRHNLAMSIQKQGDMVASEKILRHNLTINAMHQPTYHSLAQLLVTQGRAPEAQDLVATWVGTQPYVPESYVEMAWIQKQSGDIAGAEQSLQTALKVKPAHPVALAHLGELYHTTGRPDQAAVYYQRSLAANWDQPEVQSRLSTLTDPTPMSRSARMQNGPAGPMMASAPIIPGESTYAISQISTGEPMMASAPVMTGDTMMTGVDMTAMASPPVMPGVPFGNDPQSIVLEDVNSNPAPRKRSRYQGPEKVPTMAAYPLPDFGSTATAWVPSGTIPGQPSLAFQPPAIATDPMAVPQLGVPQMADRNGAVIVPQADPAHFYSPSPDMTASVPIVYPR